MKNEKQIEKKDLSQDEIEKKSEELTKTLGVKVTPFLFNTLDGEQIVGYFKDPIRLIKMRALDMYEQSQTEAGEMLLRTCLIVEESDSRILDERQKYDPIFLGAIQKAVSLVQISQDLIKKK